LNKKMIWIAINEKRSGIIPLLFLILQKTI